MQSQTHLFESSNLTVADAKRRADFTVQFDPIKLEMKGRNPHITVVSSSLPKGVNLDGEESAYYYIKCSLVQNGIKVNNDSYQIIARIPVYKVPLGEYFEFVPPAPIRIPLRASPGEKIERVRFWVTNEYHEPLDFDNNDWSLLVVIDSLNF